MKCVRIFSDSDGHSRFGETELELVETEFAPPAPPFPLSPVYSTAGIRFGTMPAGWQGDWHPAPRRQFRIQLAGQIEFEVGDGEVRQFGPGSVLLLEDVEGKGHRTRVVGNQPSSAAYAQFG